MCNKCHCIEITQRLTIDVTKSLLYGKNIFDDWLLSVQ